MSITEEVSLDKVGEVVHYPLYRKLYLAIVIVLITGLSFGIGRLTAGKGKSAVSIEFDPSLVASSQFAASNASQTTSALQASTKPNLSSPTAVYASSRGTKYYYSYCKSTVSEKNKITFSSHQEAERAGYSLAASCKPR